MLKSGATLTDLGSTKAEIMKAARRLPFVGGHPMAGSHQSGVEACDPTLYNGAPYFLVPGGGSVSAVKKIARAAGARPILVGAAEHDAIVAAVSHVPYLIAYALSATGDRSSAGPSFRDATRVASSDPDMVLDFLLTNRKAIARAGARFQSAFGRLVALVARGDERRLKIMCSQVRAQASRPRAR
jgi:prephenate dehydrogenase